MATLTGQTVAGSYKDLLQVSNSNAGIDATLRSIDDGEGTSSGLQISSAAVNTTTDFSVATSKLTVAAATGNTVVAGTLGVTGDLAVNTNKLTITAASGNTAIAGTLAVTGATTLSSTLGVGGDITLENSEVISNSTNGTVQITSGVFKHAYDAAAYWTATQADAGAVTFASVSDGTAGFTFSQAVALSSTLSVGGDITLQNSETISNSTNGTIALTAGVFKHGYDALAYWTATQADGGAVTFASVSDGTAGFTFSQAVALSSTLAVTGNVAVNTNKFTVAASTGNTVIAGTVTLSANSMVINPDTTDRILIGARIGFCNDASPADNAPANGCVLYFDGTNLMAVNSAGATAQLNSSAFA